jgi:HrpA-like RNA helicase
MKRFFYIVQDPVLTVASSLSFKDPFVIPLGKEYLADQRRCQLAGESRSDHLMLVNAFRGWEKASRAGRSRDFCWDNFLSEPTLKMLQVINCITFNKISIFRFLLLASKCLSQPFNTSGEQ